MPIFEFACAACDHHFESLVMGGRLDEVDCPSCASTKVEKQLSAPARQRSSDVGAAPVFTDMGSQRAISKLHGGGNCGCH